MGNWHNVLRAINMASCTLADWLHVETRNKTDRRTARLAKPANDADGEPTDQLPQTLVRIPTEHAPTLQAQAEAAEAAAAEDESAPATT